MQGTPLHFDALENMVRRPDKQSINVPTSRCVFAFRVSGAIAGVHGAELCGAGFEALPSVSPVSFTASVPSQSAIWWLLLRSSVSRTHAWHAGGCKVSRRPEGQASGLHGKYAPHHIASSHSVPGCNTTCSGCSPCRGSLPQATVFEVTLDAGDALYLPSCWWHQVTGGKGPNISFIHWCVWPLQLLAQDEQIVHEDVLKADASCCAGFISAPTKQITQRGEGMSTTCEKPGAQAACSHNR